MTGIPPTAMALLAEMASLAGCQRAEGYACITARREHGASSVEIPQPQFAILLEGRKQVRTAHQSLTFVPGDILLITQRCRIDVVNTPDPQTGRYLSAIVPLCTEVLAAARTLWSEALPTAGAALARQALGDHATVLRSWRQSLQDGHYSEARLALATLVLAWCRQGHGNLLLPHAPTLGEQIRDRIAAEPARDWQSRDVEAHFALSGATLRRRLAAEATSLRQLLTEARLAHGMQLLYTTDLPLKTVAARAGYRSAASFSKRFAEQYGLAPTDI
ncbi:helix-turn-helix transcriptional regulator [Stenotrophomonas indicatrix]|uniref:helix-turn-helix transcriptional regulator n=1 Tax=Stenotrophomonas indicatrix TaxID=2045451 RepID=UPI0010713632|nr:helix-turn-helix transcriptional regulator [Stenotrophomonas indicatrix]QBR45933.1 helix-turn-helix domain protein [Stenotrophomonas indicatrix]QXQ01931.1 helix-turn-helix transcriptional regulator [Stenotrophomonas indicatrix]